MPLSFWKTLSAHLSRAKWEKEKNIRERPGIIRLFLQRTVLVTEHTLTQCGLSCPADPGYSLDSAIH